MRTAGYILAGVGLIWPMIHFVLDQTTGFGIDPLPLVPIVMVLGLIALMFSLTLRWQWRVLIGIGYVAVWAAVYLGVVLIVLRDL